MADTTKCQHCGSRDTAAGGQHIHCLVCGGYSDFDGNAVGQPSNYDAFPAA